jgi:hypothetical protein
MNATAEQRFWRHVEKTKTCWYWRGSVNIDGYGQFNLIATHPGIKVVQVHRYAYQLIKGTIPPNLVLDHLCRNKRCVNPNHLEAVTSRTNTLRGIGVTAQNKKKTHCPRGHPYEGENLYARPDGGRDCRKCMRAAGKRWRDKKSRIEAESDKAPADKKKGTALFPVVFSQSTAGEPDSEPK